MRKLMALLLVLASLAGAARADAPEGLWVHVDIVCKSLTLYQGSEVVKRYGIATGTSRTPTPIGVFRITHRFSTEMSGFGTRFLGLNVPWGQYGIHGTNKPYSIGSNASHGCIRMLTKNAEDLYARVPNGTLVVIEGGPYGELDSYLPTLRPGDRSSAVRAFQRRLRANGFYSGSLDGIYGAGMSRAVLAARKAHGLKNADIVDQALYGALGVTLFE